jgi:hypothetical protein
MNAAQMQRDGTYKVLSSGDVVKIHPSSTLFMSSAPWVVFNEVVVSAAKYIRDVTAIDPLWLSELA